MLSSRRNDLIHVGHGHIGLSELALALVADRTVLALQDLLAVLVQLELGDHDLGGVNADGHRLAVGLLTHNTLDVDHELLAVDRGHAAFTVLERATDDRDFVALDDRDRANLTSNRARELSPASWS